jgi:hypothetical protein
MAAILTIASPLRAGFVQQVQISDLTGAGGPTFSSFMANRGYVFATNQDADSLALFGDLVDLSTGTSGTSSVEFLDYPGGDTVAFLTLALQPVDCSFAQFTGACDQYFSMNFEDQNDASFASDLASLGSVTSVVETGNYIELDQIFNTYGPAGDGRDIFSIQVQTNLTPEPRTISMIFAAGILASLAGLRRRNLRKAPQLTAQ